MHYLFVCPSERPISLETLHGSKPLFVETMAYVQVESGRQMDDISLSIGNDSIKPLRWL